MSCVDNGHLSDNLQRVGLGSHVKLERQGSKGSKGCPTPSRKVHGPLGNKTDTDRQSDDLHGLPGIVCIDAQLHMCLCVYSRTHVILSSTQQDSALQSWGEELKWRGDENKHTPFSERSRKQDKGGFRNSFKKLFKKKYK